MNMVTAARWLQRNQDGGGQIAEHKASKHPQSNKTIRLQ